MTQDDTHLNGPFVITGLSGSGKTVLSRGLEDSGYLCVDNIPIELVPELFAMSKDEMGRLAVVLDVRAKGMTQSFPEVFHGLKKLYKSLRLVFVEASPEILLRRYSVARRPHPLRDTNLERAIVEERDSLDKIRELADLIIDTTNLSPHDLRRHVFSLGGREDNSDSMIAEVQSFSYMQGVPATASLVFDVRFLPNPFFEPELRSLPGDHAAVVDWLGTFSEVDDAFARIFDLISYLMPRYGEELKTHLTIAVGCTGGRHRSVYVADRVAKALVENGHDATVHHRDKDRWRYS